MADVRTSGDDGIGDPEALADYTLREPDGADGDTELHAPILYVAPDTALNRKVLGVDMMLEPQRRAAMEDAVESGAAVTSPRLRLSGSDDAEAGFIVYVPVVEDGELQGWLTAAFLAEVFTRGLEVARDTSLEFEILDGVGDDAQLLHSTAGVAEDGGPLPLAGVDDAAFTSTSTVSVPGPGRTWQVRYASPGDFVPLREGLLPWLVLLLGLAVIGVVVVVSRGAERWRRLAVQLDEQAVGLHEAREAAVSAAVAKSTFLSTMSHEIRTPLNAIVGANSVLLETDLDDDQAGYVKVIRDSGSHLVHVVNEILDLAKAEAGQVVLEQERFDLHGCVGAVLDIVDGEASRKRLRVTADLDGPVWVVGDVARLRQVLINLVSNAVKFTPEQGAVRVRVSADADGHVTFEVTDTGIGVDPDQVARLFEPFVQAGAWTTRTHGGTGLGLTISRHLVEAMGGRISVESQPGRGATFRFTVLLPAADAPEPVPVAAAHATGGRRGPPRGDPPAPHPGGRGRRPEPAAPQPHARAARVHPDHGGRRGRGRRRRALDGLRRGHARPLHARPRRCRGGQAHPRAAVRRRPPARRGDQRRRRGRRRFRRPRRRRGAQAVLDHRPRRRAAPGAAHRSPRHPSGRRARATMTP